jgi:hypothetical protein
MTREEELAVAAGGPKPDLTVPPQQIAGTTQTVFLQLRQPAEAPETFGSYEKKSGKSNSVIALMEMMAKDVEKTMTEAEYDEKTAQKDYEELLTDAEETKGQETKSIATKEKSKADMEGSLEESKRGQTITLEKMEQAHTYNQDLHTSCDFILQAFDARKEARTNEVEGLKNAKAVLSGADYSF